GAPPPAPGWRRAGARGPARGERTRPGRAATRSRRAGHRARRGPPARPGRKLRRGRRSPRGARRVAADARGSGRRDAHHGGRQASGVRAARGAADSRGSAVVTEQLRMWLAARAPRERVLLVAVGTIAVLAGVLTAALAIQADLASLEARVTSRERELVALRRLAADLGPTPSPAPAGGPSLVTRLQPAPEAGGGRPRIAAPPRAAPGGAARGGGGAAARGHVARGVGAAAAWARKRRPADRDRAPRAAQASGRSASLRRHHRGGTNRTGGATLNADAAERRGGRGPPLPRRPRAHPSPPPPRAPWAS